VIDLPRPYETRLVPQVVRELALPLLAICLLVVFCAPVALEAKGASFSPDVLVLVLSGMGPFDQVSINYTSALPEQEALKDIDALARETSWLVRDTKVTTAGSSTPGARPTTSSVFRTPPLPSSRDGTLPLEPFVSVLRRFPSIEVDYLVASQFAFRGLKEFENEWVKIDLKQSGNSYLYRVRVKDKGFRRLGLPLVQPRPAAPRRAGTPAGARVLIIIGLAIAAAAVVYLAAARLSRARRSGD